MVVAPSAIAEDWRDFVESNCLACHDDFSATGDIVFDTENVDLANPAIAELWNRALDQVAFGEMPPRAEPQPASEERHRFIVSLDAALTAAGHPPDLRQKLLAPEYGNYVDHVALFDGSVDEASFTPARLWLRNPAIFDRLIDDGVSVVNPGRYGTRPADFNNIRQPFTLEERAGFNDYAAIAMADSATLDTMLRNADLLVDKMIGVDRPKRVRTPSEFEAILTSEEPASDTQIDAAITRMFELVIERHPAEEDLAKYRQLIRDCIDDAGNAEGLRLGLVAIAVSPAAIYRGELGQGEVDEHGRRMLGPVDLAFAISWALTDRKPDEQLLAAARSGNLQTREDVRREVERIWDDEAVDKPRILRFFHEFFGYHRAPGVFKDQARFGNDYRQVPEMLVKDADVLIMHIVKEDKNVLNELLTTPDYFVAHSGDNDAERVTHDALAAFYEYYRDMDWRNFEYKIAPEHMQVVRSIDRMFTHANGNVTKRWMNYLEHCDEAGISHMPLQHRRYYISLYNLDDKSWSFPVDQPFTLDPENRIGILMHPAWLLAHSLNLDNDPVRRGKWIRERLLAGTVPELPITVDASIPEDPYATLRERFQGIRNDSYCWRCHERMNPLGMPFESFDDFGRHRRGTELLHQRGESRKVDSTGAITGTDQQTLDGEVEDPVEMIRRIAESDRARQSFVRHAFRYWMGRNEYLSDSQTVVAAEQAYVENDGSFRALVVSLLTSDSFLYRKESVE